MSGEKNNGNQAQLGQKEQNKQAFSQVQTNETSVNQQQFQQMPPLDLQEESLSSLQRLGRSQTIQPGALNLSRLIQQNEEQVPNMVSGLSRSASLRTELILNKETLSEKEQQELANQEERLHHNAQLEQNQTVQKEQKAPVEPSPVFNELSALKSELDQDNDSASPSFSAVKQAMDSLAAAWQSDTISDHDKGIALCYLRECAMAYYNSHRGHRFGQKGKRRKALIKRIIASTQSLMLNEDVPEMIRASAVDHLESDTSKNGTQNMQYQEFVQARLAKEQEREPLLQSIAEMIEQMHSSILERMAGRTTASLAEMETIIDHAAGTIFDTADACCDLKKLLKHGVEPTAEMTQLSRLMREIAGTDPSALTGQSVGELIRQYKEINLPGHPSAFENLQQDEILRSPRSAYLLLHHCVSASFHHAISSLDASKLNLDALASLEGLARASGIAAGELMLHAEFDEQMQINREAIQEEKRQQEEEERRKKEEERLKKEEEERLRKEEEERVRKEEKERLRKEEERIKKEEEERIRKEEEARLKKEEEERLRKEEEERRRKEEEERRALIAQRKQQRNDLLQTAMEKFPPFIEAETHRISWYPKEQCQKLIEEQVHLRFDLTDETALSRNATTLSERDVIQYAQRRLTQVNQNLQKIDSLVSKNRSLYLKMPRLKDKICLKAAELVSASLTHASAPIDIKLIKNAAKGANVSVYRKRASLFKQSIPDVENNDAFWSDETTQQMILQEGSQNISEAEFSEDVSLLAKQAESNLKGIKKVVKRFLSSLHVNDVISELKQKLGARWIYAEPATLRVYTEEAVANLAVHMPAIHRKEQMLKNAMRNAGINPAWKKQAHTYLQDNNITVESEAELEQKLAGFQDQVEENNSFFEGSLKTAALTKTQWKALNKWRNHFASLPTQKFKEEFELYYSVVSAMEEKSSERLSMSEYLHGKAEAALKRDTMNYANRMRGEDLCTWNGFGPLLKDHQDTLMDQISEHLQNGVFATQFEFLNGVTSLEGLESLSYPQYTQFLNLLRTNIGRLIEPWSQIECVEQESVKDELLGIIVSGIIRTEEMLQNQTESILHKKRVKANASKLRIKAHLGEPLKAPGKVRFQYIESSGTKHKGKFKAFVPEERIAKFGNAKQAWELLRAEGLDTTMLIELQIANDHLKKQLQDVSPKNAYKTKLKFWKEFADNRVSQWGAGTDEQLATPLGKTRYMIATLLNSLKNEDGEGVQLKDFICEFLMCQTEEYVFSADAPEEQVFASGKDEEYYQRMMDIGSSVLSEVTNLIGGIGESDIEKRRWIFLKSREMLIKLKIFGEDTVENPEALKRKFMKQYGVESWSNFVTEVFLYSVAKDDPSDSAMLKESREVAEIHMKRQNKLKMYEGGIFDQFIPYIEADRNHWASIISGTDQEFDQFMADLDALIGTPLRQLKKHYGNSQRTVAQQFIYAYHEDILKNTYQDSKQWELEMDQFDKISYEKKLSGYDSLRDRLNTVKNELKKHPNKYGYPDEVSVERAFMQLSAAIQMDPDFYELLYSQESLIRAMKSFARNAGRNTEFLKNRESFKQMSEKDQQSFLLALGPKLYLTDSEIFEKVLPAWEIEIFTALDAVVIPESAPGLENRQKKLLQIMQKKEDGRWAQTETREKLGQLRKETWRFGSPILVKHAENAETAQVTKTDMEKAFERVDTNHPKMPEFLKNYLAERSLVEKMDDQAMFHEAVWLLSVYNAIEDGETNFKIEDEAKAQQFILYAYNQFITIVMEPSPAAINGWYAQFEQRKSVLDRAAGAIQEGGELADLDQTLQAEYRETLQILQIGMYTIDNANPETSFVPFVQDRLDAFAAANKVMKTADQLIEKLRTTTEISEDAAIRLKLSLREYFAAELEERDPEVLNQIPEEMEKLLQDDEMRKHLIEQVGGSSYLLGESDQMIHTDESRQNVDEYLDSKKSGIFQRYLTSRTEQKLLDQYNELDSDQRQIFALAILLLGRTAGNAFLPTAKMVASGMPEDGENQEYIQTQIQKYVTHDESFAPVINYSKVMEKMQTGDGEINTAIFEQAINFTQLCIEKHAQLTPKDWAKLSDGKTSADAAYRFKNVDVSSAELKKRRTARKTGLEGAASPTVLVDKLKDLLQQDKEKIDKGWNFIKQLSSSSILSRLENLKGYQFQYLILALQDRTMMDRTTAVDWKKQGEGVMHGFVNEEKREEFKEALSRGNTANLADTVKGTHCSKAILSLLSYQLRDDVDLRNRDVQKDDFRSGALERTTEIDWELLSEALDLVDEISGERLRLEAVKKAPDLIDLAPNEHAKSTYHDLKDHVTDEQSFDEFVIGQAAKEQEGNPDAKLFLAGFVSLSKAEKQLFIKALENRDLLDISKENFWYDFVGIEERDYVNRKGREELTEQYIGHFYLQEDRIPLQPDAYQKAFKTLLSTQIDDSSSFLEMKEGEDLTEHLARNSLFSATRSTAVDWSLFARALQYVKRTSNEEMIYKQDRELYLSQGDLAETGAFKFESDYMRKNYHRTGNRWTRFLARKAVDRVRDLVPPALQSVAAMVCNAKYANTVNTLFDRKAESENKEIDFDATYQGEGSSLLETVDSGYEKVSDFLDTVGDFTSAFNEEEKKSNLSILSDALYEESSKSETVAELAKKYAPLAKGGMEIAHKVTGAVGDILDPVTTWNGYLGAVISAGKEIYSSASNLVDISQAKKQAELEAEGDQERLEAAAQEQTEEEKKLSREGYDRNAKAQSIAIDSATQQQIGDIVMAATSAALTITDAALEMDGELEEIGKEVASAIMFVRQFFLDKGMVDKYYETKSDVNKEESTLMTNLHQSIQQIMDGPSTDISKMRDEMLENRARTKSVGDISRVNTSEKIQKANGFESFDEFVTYTGFNIIRSILFCASDFGKHLKRQHIIAKTVLKVLGVEDCAGDQSTESATKVYQALMGQKYEVYKSDD